MFMRDRLLAISAALALGCGAAGAESPNLGRAATPEEIAAWDISIGPDGAGLPAGSGTAKQGETVYLEKCLGCHGERGAGKPNDQLAGGQGTLGPGQAPVKTVGSFWPYATLRLCAARDAAEQSNAPNDDAVVAYYPVDQRRHWRE